MVPQLCPYCKKDLMIVLPRDGGGCPEDGTPKRIIRGCIWKALSACQGKVHSRASLLPVLNSSLFQGVLCYFQSLFAWVWQHCKSIVAPQQLLGNMMRLLGVNCAYICKTTYNPTAECRLCDLISPFWCYDVTDVAPLKLASHVLLVKRREEYAHGRSYPIIHSLMLWKGGMEPRPCFPKPYRVS